jgi:hypothetical protein
MSAKHLMILSLSVTALIVSGCAKPVSKWNHPSASAEQWAIDKAGCRSRARHRSEKKYKAENYGVRNNDDEFTAVFDKNMQSFSAQRDRQSYYENCLKRLGYTPDITDK